MNNRKPYFYIIQHKESKMNYAGAKWGKDADPDNFMTETGYKTSSTKIQEIISEEGVSAFNISVIINLEELQIPFGCQTIDEYESWFLQTNNCKTSDEWYNKMPPNMAPFGSTQFHKNMYDKYGVKTALQNEKFLDKFLKTNNELYGGNSPMCNASVRENHAKSIQIHYGEEYTNPAQVPEIKEKTKITNIIKYGGSPMCNDEIKAKTLKTLQQNHGKAYTNAAQTPKSKESAIKTSLEKYGVSSQNSIPFFCKQCNVQGKGLSTIGKFHKDHEGTFITIFGNEIEYKRK